MLGEGSVSTDANEFGGAISPDGRELYFSRSVPRSCFYAVFVSRLERGRWTTPEIARFSERYRDFDPNFSPDGRRLYFTSDRPVNGVRSTHYNFWITKRLNSGDWSEPRLLDAPLNGDKNQWFITEASDGTVYFASQRDDSIGYSHIYRSRRVGGVYQVRGATGTGPEDADLHQRATLRHRRPAATRDV
jgi:hypothetical protein